jgi:hypothetical protein
VVDHQRAGQCHRLHRVVEGFGARGLAGGQQQLRHRMQRQVGHLLHDARRTGPQHRGQRRATVQQLPGRGQQRLRGDAVLGHQAGFERVAQLAVEQLALQRGRYRLVACPQLDALQVEDVARGDDALRLAGLEDGGQRVRVGGVEGGGGCGGGDGGHGKSSAGGLPGLSADVPPCASAHS